jgi:SAM-dependent methyltransferase
MAAVSANEPESVDAALRASFERVEEAVRYREWILDLARPALGARLLEVGSGVGNFTASLLDRDLVVAVEPVPAYLAEAHRRLGSPPNLVTLAMAVEDPRLPRALAPHALDSALLLNVLEHVSDDVRGLRHVAEALVPGARVVIQVPAHRWLYGAADRALGHRRRYSPAGLRRVIDAAGLVAERVWQVNALGVAGWLLSGRVRRQAMFSRRQLRVYEALVPLLRAIEPARGVPVGLSVMAVARTRNR